MSGREFFFMMMGVLIASAAHATAARKPAKPPYMLDSATKKKIRALLPIFLGVVAIIYAAILATTSIVLLISLTFGHEPRSFLVFLMVLVMAAASAGLGWIGLRLLRDKSLSGRLARTWSTAVEAFFEPIPEGAKPKPARSEYELD